jgi:hypothetical protein
MSIVSAPEELRDQVRHLTRMQLISTLAAWRPDVSNATDPVTANRVAMKSLARRYLELTDEIADLDELINPIAQALAPQLLERVGIGIEVAGQLLVTTPACVLRNDATAPTQPRWPENVLDRKRWTTRQELRLTITTWIERTYHRRRQQRRQGILTPIEYETINRTALTAAEDPSQQKPGQSPHLFLRSRHLQPVTLE